MKKSVTSGKATAVIEKETPAPKTVAKPAAKIETAPAKAVAKEVTPTATICAESIAERAYLLWEATGYEHGRHDEHWHAAEKQLLEEAK